MMSKQGAGWVARALASGVLKWIAFQAAALVGPLLLGLATIAIGRVGDGTPWMWAIAAGALTFGGCAAGLHFMLAVAARYRVKGRLALSSPRIAVELASGELALGVNLQSLADVPIEFEIKQLRTQLAGVFAPNKPYTNTVIEIPPNGQGWFVDHVISIGRKWAPGEVVSGQVIAIIAYGRPGSRTHILEARTAVHVKFSAEGSPEASAWDLTV
jgi:hypothetical protein